MSKLDDAIDLILLMMSFWSSFCSHRVMDVVVAAVRVVESASDFSMIFLLRVCVKIRVRSAFILPSDVGRRVWIIIICCNVTV